MSRVTEARWLVLLLTGVCQASAAAAPEGVYSERCAGCHELTNPRIPHRTALQKLPASRILRSLDSGAMMTVGYSMSRAERDSVSRWLGTSVAADAPSPAAFCADRAVRFTSHATRWNGWSPDAANTRYQSGAVAKLTVDGLKRLRLKWAFGFDGDVTAFAQPTVIGAALFTGSASGAVYALDASTGCIRWVFQAGGPVRTAILAVPSESGTQLVFGDQSGWVYALRASDGSLRWKKKADVHESARLTGAPVAHDGILYVPIASWEEVWSSNPRYNCCTFRGGVVALRGGDGEQVWKMWTIPEPQRTANGWGPSGAGIWSSPTIDAKRGLLYVATGDNYSSPATTTSDAVMALDVKSGRVVWSRQFTAGDVFNVRCLSPGGDCPAERGPDHDFAASVMIVRHGKRDLLIAGQKSGMVHALNPDRGGETVWQARAGTGGLVGGVQWGMASAGTLVFAAASDAAFQPVKPGPVPQPRRATYNPLKGGGLSAFRIADGSRAWFAPPAKCEDGRENCSPAQSAAVTAIPGVVFSGSLDGHIPAFSSEDGSVIWDYDTVREFRTLNGVPGRGGSLDGPGAVVVNGMVYINSGYARFGGMPGNVLLAFAPEEENRR